MENSWRGVIYILGIIAAVYLVIRFIIPLIITGLGFLLNLIMWVAIALLAIILVAYVAKLLRNR